MVSYVRRSTRMRPAMRAALDTHGPRFVIQVASGERSTSLAPDAQVDWDETFGRSAPLAVDIGPGHGESVVAYAQSHPDTNVVGFEVFQPALAAAVARVNSAGLTNVRFVASDGAEGLTLLFHPASVTHLATYFPDPWHKTRHHRRRLISARFAALVASRLVIGGRWNLATDWEDYALAMRSTLDSTTGLVNAHPGWAPRPPDRPVTKYEARGLAAGRTIRDLEYERTS